MLWKLRYNGKDVEEIETLGRIFTKPFVFPSKKDGSVYTIFFDYNNVDTNKNSIDIIPSYCEHSWIKKYKLDEYGMRAIYDKNIVSKEEMNKLIEKYPLWGIK